MKTLYCCIILTTAVLLNCQSSNVVHRIFADAISSEEYFIVLVSQPTLDDVKAWINEDSRMYKLYSSLIEKDVSASGQSFPFLVEHEVGRKSLPPLIQIYNPSGFDDNLLRFPSVIGSKWLLVLQRASQIQDKDTLLQMEIQKKHIEEDSLMVVSKSPDSKDLGAFCVEWPNELNRGPLAGFSLSEVPRSELIEEMENLYAVFKMTESLIDSFEKDLVLNYKNLFDSSFVRQISVPLFLLE